MTALPPLDPTALGLVRPDAPGLARLREFLGPDGLRTDAGALEAHGRDETESLCFLPDAIALPRSTGEVSRTLALCHAGRWPVVPRGAGTGLSGGALPVAGGIVLSLARMDRIRELDLANLTVTAEAGVVLADLQRRVDEHGLRYPPTRRAGSPAGSPATWPRIPPAHVPASTARPATGSWGWRRCWPTARRWPPAARTARTSPATTSPACSSARKGRSP
ncbi:MAG: FAD-binding oxidoreductase [Thermoanaerobaculia bacterium]|nr:FAD-binding oxidoreductase [Thermoanaerobaculia bacterium]